MTNFPTISRNSITISAAVVACLAFSACGAIAEKVTEEGAERIIESETGEDVELDFDSGDGSFSLQTEDGSFSVDEDGSFVVTDENGSVFTGTANDDGVVVLDDDGNPVVNVSGDGSGDIGEISIQGENGDDVFRVLSAIPAEWPSDLPRPEGLSIESGSFTSSGGETLMSVIGSPSGSAIDYAADYADAVAAAGLGETGSFDSSSNGATTTQRTYENDAWSVNVNGYSDDSSNVVSVTLISKG